MAPASSWILAPPGLTNDVRYVGAFRQIVNGKDSAEAFVLPTLAWVTFSRIVGLKPIQRLRDVLKGRVGVVAQRWPNPHGSDHTSL